MHFNTIRRVVFVVSRVRIIDAITLGKLFTKN